MQTRRRQTNQGVARLNGRAVDQPRTLDHADDEAGDVVLAVRIEAWHLRSLAADERAPVLATSTRHSGDHLFGHVGRQTTSREIVEEEQRHRALHEDVVDAVVHQICANRVVTTGHEREFELGADTVRAGDEHRIGDAGSLQVEQAAERSDL